MRRCEQFSIIQRHIFKGIVTDVIQHYFCHTHISLHISHISHQKPKSQLPYAAEINASGIPKCDVDFETHVRDIFLMFIFK